MIIQVFIDTCCLGVQAIEVLLLALQVLKFMTNLILIRDVMGRLNFLIKIFLIKFYLQGFLRACEKGWLSGNPVAGVRFVLQDGRYNVFVQDLSIFASNVLIMCLITCTRITKPRISVSS